MIDLHLHTTASDGCDNPVDLVRQVAQAGIRIFAVTDHDTVAALPAVRAAAAEYGLGWIPGIEITAVDVERDVHVLGYGFDIDSPALATFLVDQRQSRLDRIEAFGTRFAELGMPFDAAPLVAAGRGSGRAVGRGHVARALVAAGHVASVEAAFDDWLSRGRPGFVARRGASVTEVIERVRDAGGVASLAHPALLRDDGLVTRLVAALDAIEVHHSEHDPLDVERYRRLAAGARLAVSGGSDFHGAAANRRRRLGDVSLPADEYRELRRRARERPGACHWPDTGLPS